MGGLFRALGMIWIGLFLFLSFLEILGVVCMSGFWAGFGKVFFNFFSIFGLDLGLVMDYHSCLN